MPLTKEVLKLIKKKTIIDNYIADVCCETSQKIQALSKVRNYMIFDKKNEHFWTNLSPLK